jgi:hypothetical protein
MAALAAQVQVGGLRELPDQLVQMLAILALRSRRAVLAVLLVLLFLVIQTLHGLHLELVRAQFLKMEI